MNRKNRDCTNWLNIDEDYLDSHQILDICGIVYVNIGCSDMHHEVVFSNGETLSLALEV